MIPRLEFEDDERPRRRWFCVACRVFEVVPGTQRCGPCGKPGAARPSNGQRSQGKTAQASHPCKVCGGQCPMSPVSKPTLYCGDVCRLEGRRVKRRERNALETAARRGQVAS